MDYEQLWNFDGQFVEDFVGVVFVVVVDCDDVVVWILYFVQVVDYVVCVCGFVEVGYDD